MKIIALIQAREGSKRLPHKNRLDLCGKTMVEHAITHARQALMIDDIIVLSNDVEVKKKVLKQPDIIFEQEPEELACDNTPAMDYIKYIESKYEYDFLVLLQPTSPIRTGEDIDKCVKILQADDSIDSVVTIRRHLRYLFYPNGNIYVIRRGKDFYNDNMVCVVLDEKKSVDVDTEFNFRVAKMILEGEKK